MPVPVQIIDNRLNNILGYSYASVHQHITFFTFVLCITVNNFLGPILSGYFFLEADLNRVFCLGADLTGLIWQWADFVCDLI